MELIGANERIDELDSYKIIQNKNGYRFSDDSVQLANFVLPLKSVGSVVDLGTGSGVIPLILAQKTQIQNIIGIEIQDVLTDIARRNIALNNLASRIKIVKYDLREISQKKLFPEKSFCLVISNPPYSIPVSGRLSPSLEKRIAKTETACSLKDIVEASKYLVSENGRIAFSYTTQRLRDMLNTLECAGLKVMRLKFIYPKSGGMAKRFLIEAMRK